MHPLQLISKTKGETGTALTFLAAIPQGNLLSQMRTLTALKWLLGASILSINDVLSAAYGHKRGVPPVFHHFSPHISPKQRPGRVEAKHKEPLTPLQSKQRIRRQIHLQRLRPMHQLHLSL